MHECILGSIQILHKCTEYKAKVPFIRETMEGSKQTLDPHCPVLNPSSTPY